MIGVPADVLGVAYRPREQCLRPALTRPHERGVRQASQRSSKSYERCTVHSTYIDNGLLNESIPELHDHHNSHLLHNYPICLSRITSVVCATMHT